MSKVEKSRHANQVYRGGSLELFRCAWDFLVSLMVGLPTIFHEEPKRTMENLPFMARSPYGRLEPLSI